jgi:CubicO group peptidase (beta-lactamase class C family)
VIRACLFVALAAACNHTPAEPSRITALTGLWSGDAALDVGPRGELVVTRDAGGWHAHLGAATGALAETGDELAGAVGTGKVRLRKAGDRLIGHWIQPANAIDQAFASPIALTGAAGTYRGTVATINNALHFNLMIDGDTAWLREPEQNLGRFLGNLTIARTGDALTFTAKTKLVARGTLASDRLRFAVVEFGGPTAELVRTTPLAAPTFAPRPTPATDLATPGTVDDGWRVGTPESVGMDRAALLALVRTLSTQVPTGLASPALHALVIARRGVIVVEEYFAGHRADLPHDLRSAGKSFTTTLAGIEIDRGRLALDAPIAPTDPDARKRAVTLAHLLTMSTGLACDDNDDASPGNEEHMQDTAKDWYGYTRALPMAHAAGDKALYCSATINLIGWMIAERTHAWLPELLVEELLAPLDISDYHVNLQPDGQAYLGGGLHLRARDFAKLAQLFVDHGTWRGRQVVSRTWTEAAIAAHASIDGPDNYGYGWWRITYEVDGTSYPAFYASGNGGQLSIAVPALALVVTVQAGNYQNYPAWRGFRDELVPTVIRAIRR